MMYCYWFSTSGQEENSLNSSVCLPHSQKEIYRQQYQTYLISSMKVEVQWGNLKT